MTLRQQFLKTIYPLWMWYSRVAGKRNLTCHNQRQTKPIQSFYELTMVLGDGERLPLAAMRGKKVLLVNTASNCGYTGQYSDLQELSEEYSGRVVVLGFPANDFKEQEKLGDPEIKRFCEVNFGVSFPLAAKQSVKKGPAQGEVFRWLSDRTRNGWNDRPPSWNFSKYLVNEEGVLTDYFAPAVGPLSAMVKKAIDQ
jgi:glutathione peroxidase